jgi:two-component sensor histidine kinase/PAS domain-containing protein
LLNPPQALPIDMSQLTDFLFGAPGAAAPAGCLVWEPYFVGLRALADSVSALAYLAILAAAAVFLWRRHDLAPVARLLGGLLIAFLLAGVLTHLIAVLTLWMPIYRTQVAVKLVTALVSIGAAILVWPQIPRLLALPSPRDLARSNEALGQANVSLETTIAWRTHELAQSKERFEMALSRSNITTFTQDRDLRYTWVHNPRLGIAAEDMIGLTDAEVSPGQPDEAAALKRSVLAAGETASGAVSITSRTEGVRHFDLTISPTRDPFGEIDGILCTAVDVTEKRLFDVRLAAMAAQVATSYRRFELALEGSPITVFEQDRDLRYGFIQNPPRPTVPEDYLGRADHEVLDAGDAARLEPVKRRVLETRQGESLEVEIGIDGQRRYYEMRLEPRLSPFGEVEGVLGTAVDLTDRRRNEQQMRLVMRELTHRSKNLLAVIQAMARKTASMAPDVESFIRDFSARLRAIAASHDLLVAESWSGAEMRALLTASLAQTIDPGAPEIRIDGPPVRVSPDTAQTLGLAFHELTMNAARHGALSVPGGRLEVVWERIDGEIRFVWRESGGPTVEKPSRNGFGRVLLERLVGATLNGTVMLDFQPDGLVCTISFPADRLTAA